MYSESQTILKMIYVGINHAFIGKLDILHRGNSRKIWKILAQTFSSNVFKLRVRSMELVRK